MKFESIKPGMILLDIHKHTCGNSTVREWRALEVKIISVDEASRTAVVRWNHNKPETWAERRLKMLKTKKTKALLAQEARAQEARAWMKSLWAKNP